MIRLVSFKKAIVGGVLGAIVWEAVARILVTAGVPVFDIVRTLGLIVFGDGRSAALWWPVGLAMHSAVGAVWATFYAYFFWSIFDLRPPLQAMIFSLLPAALAGLVMVPQLDVMIGNACGNTLGIFAFRMGIGGPAMLIGGHLIYGLVLGSIYVKPVGYRRGESVKTYA
jgi:hypothetical protein